MAFSENFESFKESAAEAAKTASRKTKMAAQIAKDKMLILKEQERVHKGYTELGRIYYKDYVTDEEPDEAEYLPWCDKIGASFRRIAQLKEDIAQAKRTAAAAGEDLNEDDIPPAPEAPADAEAPEAPVDAEPPIEP